MELVRTVLGLFKCRKDRKNIIRLCLFGIVFCGLLSLLSTLDHVYTGEGVKSSYRSSSILSNNSMHQQTTRSVRIFCVIVTTEKAWMTRRLAVQLTWAPRCDNYCFFYSPANNHSTHNDPHACAVKTPDGRGNLSRKVFESFNFVRNNFKGTFDWILRADDDSYVIMENLRAFLSKYNPAEAHYFGHLLSNALYVVPHGHFSGGGGYVLSSTALDTLLTNNTCRFIRHGFNSDLNVARCLSLLKIYPESTIDEVGLNRFHSEDLIEMLLEKLKDRTYNYRKGNYTVIKGEHGILSVNTISFHHVPYKVMYAYEYLIYDLKRKIHA